MKRAMIVIGLLLGTLLSAEGAPCPCESGNLVKGEMPKVGETPTPEPDQARKDSAK